jgi:cellulose synthase/poly-beta-1,6-N-acetylglucosamine synthase-like glycosyltransferase
MKLLFWISFIAIFYIYIGYPAIAYVFSLCFNKPIRKDYIYPRLSILIAVYNEEANIEGKIKSILESDYPKDKMKILIGSDASNDKTDEIVRRYEGHGVKLVRQDTRQGKPSLLNRLAGLADSEILVFTDARQRIEKDALKELIANFNDASIGSVSAELYFKQEESQVGSGMGLYWDYEKFIRKSESSFGSMLGATGALYAVRKELFSPVAPDMLLDDMYIPMLVTRKGYRAIFDKNAKIYDNYSSGAREEFARKVRTLAGNFQLFAKCPWLFNPFKSPVAWQIISHKALRLLAPYFLVLMFLSNFNIVFDSVFYALFLILQLLFYIFAALGTAFKGKSKLFDIPYMFCVMNAAAVQGLGKFLVGKQEVVWKK